MLKSLRISYPPVVLCCLLTLLGGCGSAEPSTRHSLNHGLRRAFRILRTPPEELRGNERVRILKNFTAAGPQTIASKPQLVGTEHGRLWIFSTSKHMLCIVQARGGGCAPLKAAIKRGAYLGVFRPPTKQRPVLHNFLAQGVVPDDVKRVLVLVGTKRPRTRVVPVKDNIFSVGAEQPVHVKRLLR